MSNCTTVRDQSLNVRSIHFVGRHCLNASRLFLGEMWISITMTIVIELVPADLRTTCVAMYLFIITNIGGNAPLLVTPIQNAFHGHGMSTQDSLRGKF